MISTQKHEPRIGVDVHRTVGHLWVVADVASCRRVRIRPNAFEHIRFSSEVLYILQPLQVRRQFSPMKTRLDQSKPIN